MAADALAPHILREFDLHCLAPQLTLRQDVHGNIHLFVTYL
jgi:hypothetical protein